MTDPLIAFLTAHLATLPADRVPDVNTAVALLRAAIAQDGFAVLALMNSVDLIMLCGELTHLASMLGVEAKGSPAALDAHLARWQAGTL